MGRTQKATLLKVSTVSSVTPQPNAAAKRPNKKLQKSEPPAKRKKLAQELDEELSDSEFDAQLDRMRAEEKQLKGKKFDNLKNSKDEDDSEGDDDEEDSEDEDVELEDDDDDSDDMNEETEDEDVISDDKNDEYVDSDDSDGEDTDLDDDEVISREDEDSDGDNDDSHMEHEDASATKSVTKSQAKKAKSDSKKKQQIKKAEENIPIEATEMAQDLIAKASRDKRTLFLKNLPQSVTADKIRSFSSDVLAVRIQRCKARKTRKSKCAFVEFSDEETAVINKANFENKKIDDNEISVDFVGEKSIFRPKKPQFPSSVDPRKLYISGIGKDTTAEDLKKLFPTALSIDFPHYKKEDRPKGYAFIHFTDEKACKDAHATMQNQAISGRVLTVMYAKKSQPESKDSKKTKQSSHQPRTNKKTATETVQKKDNSEERDSGESTGDSSEDDSGGDSGESTGDSSEDDSN